MDFEQIKNIAIPVIGAVATWLSKDRILEALNIKKEKNTVEHGQLENVQKALDLWQEMLDDAVKRHKIREAELMEEINQLRETVKALR